MSENNKSYEWYSKRVIFYNYVALFKLNRFGMEIGYFDTNEDFLN